MLDFRDFRAAHLLDLVDLGRAAAIPQIPVEKDGPQYQAGSPGNGP